MRSGLSCLEVPIQRFIDSGFVVRIGHGKIRPGEMSAPYLPAAIANLVLDWADRRGMPITPLKLQKLLYFVHADYLLETSRPFLGETFEAWTFGPVLPSVYRSFREFSGKPIRGRAYVFNPVTCSPGPPSTDLADEDREHLRRCLQVYGEVEAHVLSERTHVAGGPWHAALRQFERQASFNRAIPDELIRAHHRRIDA